MEWKSFDDWIDRGRVVKRGEKSITRSLEGEPLFCEEQTRGIPITYYSTAHVYRTIDPYAEEDDVDDLYGITAFDLGADF